MRTVLITGSTKGIGNKIAKRILKDGHRVSLGARNPKDFVGTELDPEFYGDKNILINQYDANDKNSITDWVKNTREEFGRIDTVIHSAGIFKDTDLIFDDNQFQEIEELWKVNVLGPWLLTRAIWEDLQISGNGRIQIMVSMSGKRSKGRLAGYSMSKFALMGLCQTMRNEGWESGIRVTAFCPGWVNTDMAKNINLIDKKDMTQPESIAEISSTLLKLPNSAIPFEIAINCILEK